MRLKGFISVLLYFVIQYTVLIIMSLLFKELSFIHIVISQLLTLIPIYFINRNELNSRLLKGLNEKGWLRQAIQGVAWIYLLTIILSIIITTFNIPIKEASNQATLEALFVNTPKAFIFLGTIILAPLLEEIVFRFSLINIFTNNQPSKSYLPYIISALIFTCIHDTSIFTNFSASSVVNFLTYFNLSLVLVLIYKKSHHNLLLVILIHAFNNFLALII